MRPFKVAMANPARHLALLGIGTVSTSLWRGLQALVLLTHPKAPWSRRLTKATPVGAALSPLAAPLLQLLLVAQAFRLLLPDQWRSLQLWRRILPIFSRYMWTKHSCEIARSQHWISDEEVDRRWAARHVRGGMQVHRMVTDMGGYYVKSAQILATKREIIPLPWCDELARLWDDGRSRHWRHVCASLQRNLRQCCLAPQLGLVLMPGSSIARAQSSAAPETSSAPVAAADTATSISMNSRGGSSTTVSCRKRRSVLRRLLPQRFRRQPDPVTVVFDSVEQAPLASASVAQVHGARLSSATLSLLGSQWTHGPEVVVKVQHHDVRAQMGSDLRNLGRVAGFLAPLLPFKPAPIVAEMQRSIPREFDFAREARLTGVIRRRLTQAGFDDRLVVPEPVIELSAPGLIVQQRMAGVPFTALLRMAHAATASLSSSTVTSTSSLEPAATATTSSQQGPGSHMDTTSTGVLQGNQPVTSDAEPSRDPTSTHADTQPSSSDPPPSTQAQAAGQGSRGSSSSISSLLPAGGSSAHPQPLTAPAPAAVQTAVEVLFQAYGVMIFQQGLFHGDPHPGNFLLQEDGKVVLLDFGQVKAFTELEHIQVATLFSALGRNDVFSAIAAASALGLHFGVDSATGSTNMEAVKLMMTIMFDSSYLPEASQYSFGGGEFVPGAPLDAFPASLYLICRVVLLLRGLCYSLGLHNASVVKIWAPLAAAALTDLPSIKLLAIENAKLDRPGA